MRVTRLCAPKATMRAEPRLTLDDLDRRFQAFILDVYQVQPP